MLDRTREPTLTSMQKKRKLRHRKVNLAQYTGYQSNSADTPRYPQALSKTKTEMH